MVTEYVHEGYTIHEGYTRVTQLVHEGYSVNPMPFLGGLSTSLPAQTGETSHHRLVGFSGLSYDHPLPSLTVVKRLVAFLTLLERLTTVKPSGSLPSSLSGSSETSPASSS
jgi:hypothetical protein